MHMDGSSRTGSARRKSSKTEKRSNVIRNSKAKKISVNQKIEALDQEASEYSPPDSLKLFADLPISDLTKRGLKKAFFVDMTDIQLKSIPISLKGRDVLGAARTGSGKTLAFLIPVLEILYRRKWGPQDGLGALIISPTRELAVQIFEVLRSIGSHHSFSAGLVIGGKSLKDERERLSRMNILVATPGRLLHHMDQTFGFESDNLQTLVLDEADRILDMGFSRTVSALLSHLPKSRQTLLFSATQTQSVTDLARLSLKDPVYVEVKEAGFEGATPQNLQQSYLLCELGKKLDILWSFIKSHLQSKVLVFMSSCKQVRFVFETFCRMHPGIPLLHLHGKQKQPTRLAVYQKFTSTSHAVLFATDIAARGLDFPSVDWVLQLDAPEDADTYIHRVGRTARYESAGRGLIFLLPSEEQGMKEALEKKNIVIEKIKVRPSKTHSIENQLQKLAFQDPEIKYLGQRAFVSYLRSIHLHKDKAIFKLSELPIEKFAQSLGLPGAPKIKFLNKEVAKQKKNASMAVSAAQLDDVSSSHSAEEESVDDSNSSDSEKSGDGESTSEEGTTAAAANPAVKNAKNRTVRTKYDRMFERKNQNILSEHYSKLIDHSGDENDVDDFITLKRSNHDLLDSGPIDSSNLSKRKQKMSKTKRMLKENGLGTKLIFDDEGIPHQLYEMADAEEFFKEGLESVKDAGKKFAQGERGKMEVANVRDKEEAREKKREKKRKRKDHEKEGDGSVAVLATPLPEDGYISPDFEIPSGSDEEDQYQRNHSPLPKRRKAVRSKAGPTIEEEEEMALRLLRKR